MEEMLNPAPEASEISLDSGIQTAATSSIEDIFSAPQARPSEVVEKVTDAAPLPQLPAVQLLEPAEEPQEAIPPASTLLSDIVMEEASMSEPRALTTAGSTVQQLAATAYSASTAIAFPAPAPAPTNPAYVPQDSTTSPTAAEQATCEPGGPNTVLPPSEEPQENVKTPPSGSSSGKQRADGLAS